jgi:putative transposase
MGVSEQTFYRWNKKFAGVDVPELCRLKQQVSVSLRSLRGNLFREFELLEQLIGG